MRANSIRIWLMLAVVAMLSACSTDFDTIAPYKETMALYGLINQNDSVQYLRIGKAFLGEGNALIMAKENDSIYYGDYLKVKLVRYNASNFVEATDNLTRIISDTKEPGIFSYPTEVMYQTSPNFIVKNDESKLYKLTVTNTHTGLIATSSTRSIKNLATYSKNLSDNTDIDFTRSQVFQFYPSALAKVYNITIKVKYYEMTATDTVIKSFDWNFGDYWNSISDLNTLVQYVISTPEFFRTVSAYVEPDASKKRMFLPKALAINLYAGTPELYTYMQVTQPSTGVVQDRPLYTNITNGVGIFTSRNQRIINAGLSQSTLAALDTSSYTRNLNFVH